MNWSDMSIEQRKRKNYMKSQSRKNKHFDSSLNWVLKLKSPYERYFEGLIIKPKKPKLSNAELRRRYKIKHPDKYKAQRKRYRLRYREKYPDKYREVLRKRGRSMTEKLTNHIIRKYLNAKKGEIISQDLIESKRLQVKILRFCKAG